MVHIVKNRINGVVYLALQETLFNRKKNKRYTKHIAYLGREDKWSKERIDKEIKNYG